MWCEILATALACAPTDGAPLRLPALFGDSMVLQRQARVPVWGWAAPGADVRVKAQWAEAEFTTRADAAGRWKLELATPAAGGPFTLRVACEREITLQDVWVGEVWLCSGQSNMEWSIAPGALGGVFDAEQLIAEGTHPRIRHFDVANATALRALDDVSGTWTVASPDTVGSFSAVAYTFALELERELDCAIGIVNATWSGTRIQAWLPEAAVAADVDARAEYAAFVEQRSKLELAGTHGAAQLDPQTVSVLHNAMVAPLAPYRLAGALWYQGESNRVDFEHYERRQRALVDGLRDAFGVSDLPFYYVQIAPFSYGGDRGETGALRDAQLRALGQAGTGMAVTLDIGDPLDIHPRNKREVGRRLSLWALAKTYGREDLVHSGPLVRSAHVEGGAMRVEFDHAADGLISGGDHLTGFEIAGEDRVFHRGRAEIEGSSVVVSSREVEKPVAVRYGFAADSQPILFNRAWLPAAAFRTDTWPVK